MSDPQRHGPLLAAVEGIQAEVEWAVGGLVPEDMRADLYTLPRHGLVPGESQ